MRRDALRYVRVLEWPIFPIFEPLEDGSCSCGKSDCSSPGKHPRTFRGVKAAATNVKQIKKWWRLWPNANIGLSTNNGLVLDIDGPRGERDLKKLEKRFGKLPKTIEAETSKGRHLFFGARKRVPSKTHVLGSTQIDSRGAGGYVLLPPSRHASGSCYRWRRSPFEYELATAPKWLEGQLRCNFYSHSLKDDGSRAKTKSKRLRDENAPKLAVASQAASPKDRTRSGRDARAALSAMREGATDDEVRKMLLRTSSKAREEGERYIWRTIEWARSFRDDGLSRVRVIRARVERLGPVGSRGQLVRVVMLTTTRFWKRILLQIVVPSRFYVSEQVRSTFRAVFRSLAKPRDLRRLRHGAEVTGLFRGCFFDVSRDRFGNVRHVRRVRQ